MKIQQQVVDKKRRYEKVVREDTIREMALGHIFFSRSCGKPWEVTELGEEIKVVLILIGLGLIDGGCLSALQSKR